MSTILDEICRRKREYVQACMQAVPLTALEDKIGARQAARDFEGALRAEVAVGRFGLIAEMKRVSPSAGAIRPDFDPEAIAREYAAAGAACLSVLTDQPYFKGRDRDVAAAGAAGLPILRKDFMVDPYQVAEARAIGADCILIIMAAVTDAMALLLHEAAGRYGLQTLIEVHDEAEMERALALPGGMIGINNRNLKDLKTDLAVTGRLARRVPAGRLVVSESGLKGNDDLRAMAGHGVRCFLVGEHLLKEDDLAAATRAMLGL